MTDACIVRLFCAKLAINKLSMYESDSKMFTKFGMTAI